MIGRAALLVFLAVAVPRAARAQLPRPLVPDSVGALAVAHWERFPQASDGELFRYRGTSSFFADVFVYPRSAAGMKEQVAAFLGVMSQFRQRGDFDDFKVLSDTVIEVGSPGTQGTKVVVEMNRGSDRRDSYFFLFPLAAADLKIRITFAAGSYPDEQVMSFVRQLVPDARKRIEAAGRKTAAGS